MPERRRMPRYPAVVPVADDHDGEAWQVWEEAAIDAVTALRTVLDEATDGSQEEMAPLASLLDRWERRTESFQDIRAQFLRDFTEEELALAPVAVLSVLVQVLQQQVGALNQMVDHLFVEVGTLRTAVKAGASPPP